MIFPQILMGSQTVSPKELEIITIFLSFDILEHFLKILESF